MNFPAKENEIVGPKVSSQVLSSPPLAYNCAMNNEILLEPTCCPLCGADSCREYLRGTDQSFGVPGIFILVRCNVCMHIYMNPRPTADSIPACYPTGYVPHRPVVAKSELSTTEPTRPLRRPWYLSSWARGIPGLRRLYYWLVDTHAEFIPKRLVEQPRALELGCAGGRFLDRLRADGWVAQGVELMPEPAAQARGRGFEVHQGTLEDARLADSTFDAAFAFMVLEHLTDPLGTLLEFQRVLKPTGYLVFSIPNTGSWEAWLFGRYWSDHDLPRHLQHFTLKSIGQFLSKAGFTDVQVTHQRTVHPLFGSLGAVMSENFPRSKIGSTLKRWFWDNPPLGVYLSGAALIKLLVPILGSGRLTVVARKPEGNANVGIVK